MNLFKKINTHNKLHRGGVLLSILLILLGSVYPVSAADTVTLTVDSNIKNGTVTLSKYSGSAGDSITVTVTPKTGYKLKEGSLKYTTNLDSESEITNKSFLIPSTSSSYVLFDASNPVDYNTINTGSATTSYTDATGPISYSWTSSCQSVSGADYYNFYGKAGVSINKFYNNDESYIGDTLIIDIDGLIIQPSSGMAYLEFYVYDTPSTWERYTSSTDGILTVKLTKSSSISKMTLTNETGNDGYCPGAGVTVNSITLVDSRTPTRIKVTAEFEPVNVNYQVNHYVEQLDGSYKLDFTETKTAKADTKINIVDLIKSLLGFSNLKSTN